MPSLTKAELADTILVALDGSVNRHGATDDVPFRVEVDGLLPMAIYAFTVTDPPGGRDPRELKIQLIAPGHLRGQRGTFVPPKEDDFVVLLGYSAYYNVFVLWDAYKHTDFAWSKNCQVRLAPITDARVTGIGRHERRLRGGALETIICARPSHLREALAQRIETV
jgi:hypothetical protein